MNTHARSLISLIRILGLGFAALASAAPAAAQGMAPPLQLVFYHPFRPGVLQQCEHAQLVEPHARNARVVETAFSLQWQGGHFEQEGPVPDETAPGATPLTDFCFVLMAGGRPFTQGAVVSEMSARRLDFPTLVRLRTKAGEPTRYRLQERFPAAP